MSGNAATAAVVLTGRNKMWENDGRGENMNVHVNQIGYRPRDRKRAMVSLPAGIGGVFAVVAEDGREVWTGQLAEPMEDPASGDRVAAADFSGLTREGSYTVRVPGIGESPPFRIAKDVYRELRRALLKFFYFQRCGMDLEERYAGPWAHRACHTADAVVYGASERRLPCSGGWHDAGDYGKYTVPAAKAVADLLLAWDWFPDAFRDPVGIPESSNGLPDILNEVRYELEWMLKMQDPEDGGVFHKVTTRVFPPLRTMPEEDAAELVLSPVSVAATATFAAATAMAARVYRPFDAEFAERLLAAAERAWRWLEEHPEDRGFRNPPDIATGEYGDETTADERYWAQAELYRTTGDERYRARLLALLERGGFSPYGLGWADVGGYGTLAYLTTNPTGKDAAAAERLREEWIGRAEQWAELARGNGYGVAMEPEDYIWGSTMVLMNRAMFWIAAHRLGGSQSLAEAAREHVHYLLGRNPLGRCYVTGFGAAPVLRPHHRPSAADGVAEPVPGMVAGGPNLRLQDDAARGMLRGMPPARCYVDHEESFSTNEVAIYWNSPAVFVLASTAV